jgi:hypothetical protein
MKPQHPPEEAVGMGLNAAQPCPFPIIVGTVTMERMSRYQALRTTGNAVRKAGRSVTALLWFTGLYYFLVNVQPLLPDTQEKWTWGERRVMGIVALVTLGGFGLAGWVAGRLTRVAAELIEVFVDGAEAAVHSSYLIEAQLVPAIIRSAAAMERLAEGGGPARAAESARRAILEGRWSRAEQLLEACRRDDPHAPEVAALATELAQARQAEADDLRARLEAARAAGDPEEVIACRDALTLHLRGEPLKDLDRRVVRWLASLIQKRAQAGPITPDLAGLAARVADSFADTAEGATIHDALPDLRRRAGLCPSCARPYRGNAEACPVCRADHSDPPPRPRPGKATPGGRP